jgi:hypothetical protein
MPAILSAEDWRLSPFDFLNGEDPTVSDWNRMKKKGSFPQQREQDRVIILSSPTRFPST